MAAAYCLPKQYAAAFMAALKDGRINPGKLADMSSGERRTFFEGVVGAEHAQEVNALFESKLLLKDQKTGLANWAKKIAGISEPTRKDLLSKINKLNDVLQPADENKFLADLAARKLGVTVTADEAKEIVAMSKRVEDALTDLKTDSTNEEKQIQYGLAMQDLTERIEDMKPHPKSWLHLSAEILNIPRTLLTMGHFSAPFVQGWGLISTKQWAQGYGSMVKFFANEENYRRFNASIIGHPNHELAMRAGLSLTKLGDKLSAREEALQSTLVEKAGEWLKDNFGLPNLPRAGSRGFTGYLNFVRWRTFNDLVEAAKLRGEDLSIGSQVSKDLARTVNNFSGRGSLGPLENSDISAVLNSIFFAPRKIAGTIQMFNPVNVLNPAISKTARIAHVRLLAGSIAATGAMLGVARMVGAEINLDPRNAEFGKIKIGATRFDVTGGNDIYLRLLGRLATNQEITAKGRLIEFGKGYKPTTRADLVLQFMRGKLAPVASTIANALYGSDAVGRPFSVTQEMRDKLIPITIGSWINFFENDPHNTAAILPALAGAIGVGVEPPLPNQNQSNRDVWGDPTGTIHDDAVEKKLNELGIYPNDAEHKIRGVQLSDELYDMYQQYSGKTMKAALSQALKTPGFDRFPLGRQEQILRNTWQNARDQATNVMLAKNAHIISEAYRLKQERLSKGSPAAIAKRAQQ